MYMSGFTWSGGKRGGVATLSTAIQFSRETSLNHFLRAILYLLLSQFLDLLNV